MISDIATDAIRPYANLPHLGDHLLGSDRAPEKLSLESERLFAERVCEARKDLACQCAAVHSVDPLRLQLLNAIHHAADGLFMRENSSVPIQFAHGQTEILANDGRLIAGLNEKIRREKAARFLLPQHHGIPVMYMRSFQEAQLATPQIDYFTIALAHDATLAGKIKAVQVQGR